MFSVGCMFRRIPYLQSPIAGRRCVSGPGRPAVRGFLFLDLRRHQLVACLAGACWRDPSVVRIRGAPSPFHDPRRSRCIRVLDLQRNRFCSAALISQRRSVYRRLPSSLALTAQGIRNALHRLESAHVGRSLFMVRSRQRVVGGLGWRRRTVVHNYFPSYSKISSCPTRTRDCSGIWSLERLFVGFVRDLHRRRFG